MRPYERSCVGRNPFTSVPDPQPIMKTSPPLLLVSMTTLVIAFGLTACSPAATVDDVPTAKPAPVGPVEVPEPTPTANALDDDELLLISAVATTADGAQLDLATQVHLAIPFDDVAGQTLPQAMIDDCGSSLTLNILRDQAWSFTRVNTSALLRGSIDWPSDARIDLRPLARDAFVAGRGMLANDGTTGDELCHQDKYFVGPGNGAIALGLAGDASRYTGWASEAYGFVVPAGVTLSDCVFEVTALGGEHGAGGPSWASRADASACVIGAVDRIPPL